MDKLQIAIHAAQLGAENAQKYFNKDLKIELKEDLTPVTIADKNTETVIKEYISSQIPDAKFVGEEFGGSYDSDNYWLIDPIDGTAFFARGIPLWGTLITYIEHGKAVIGVSYIPFFDELLYAEKGKGAFLNEIPVHVSERKTIQEAFISHGSIHKIVDKVPGFIELSKKVHKMKGIGDSYGYHLLAQGKIEAKFDGAAMPFDIAGLNLVIEEAGGKVTNFQGEPSKLSDNNVLATNGLIHDEVVRIINNTN